MNNIVHSYTTFPCFFSSQNIAAYNTEQVLETKLVRDVLNTANDTLRHF